MSFEHIFTAHAQKRLFRNFRSKSWPRHSLRRPRFPIRQMHFHYRVTFTVFLCYYVAWPCDLDLWPFDLESVSCTVLLMSDPHTDFLLSYDYRLLSYDYWISDYISPYLKQSLRMRRVTWPLTGAKIVYIFEIPDPNLPIHFVTLGALRRRLSHVIGKK